MTNLELAQQQGNQAAPNLLDAANAGEFGGGGSLTSPKPSDIVGRVALSKHYALSEAQLKIIKEKLDFIRGTQIEVILVETGGNSYLYINDRVLARCKSVLQSLVEQKIAAQAGYTLEVIAAVSEVQSGWTDISEEEVASSLALALASLYFNTSINNPSSIPGLIARINLLDYFDTSMDYIQRDVFTLIRGDGVISSTTGIDDASPISNLGYQPDNDIFSSEMPVKFTEPIITYGHSLAPNGIRFTVNIRYTEQSTVMQVDTYLPVGSEQFDGPVYIPVTLEPNPDNPDNTDVVVGALEYPDNLSPEVAAILTGEVAPRLQTWLESFDANCLAKVINTEAELVPLTIDSLDNRYAVIAATSANSGNFQVIPDIADPIVLRNDYNVLIPCISCFCSDEVVEP